MARRKAQSKTRRTWYRRGSWWRRIRQNHKYRDRLFRYLFRNKKDLLSLYNALNDSNYTDEDELEIVTMEDVIFLKMKNDLSFIIGWKLNLYEQQSTYTPNMPMRGFLYFAQQYEGLTSARGDNLYSTKMVELPTPAYVVFYNGSRKMDDRETLYLSDSFRDGRGSGCLECRCEVLNINRGHNQAIMEKCRRLWEYSEFTSEIDENVSKGMSLAEALQDAIDDCIERNILRDILLTEKAEVQHMILTEFDEKKYKKAMREEGFEDGFEDGLIKGREEGLEEGRNSIRTSILELLAEKGSVPETISRTITAETDMAVLKRWLKLAAKADSIETFENTM